MIKENNSIPLFVFEYFAQKEVSDLIDKTLEETCLYHFNKADGHGIISALIVLVKRRRHLEFLDDVQATEMIEMFAKKRRGKIAVI